MGTNFDSLKIKQITFPTNIPIIAEDKKYSKKEKRKSN